MENKALTVTVITNMTSNYGEGLGNISSVQKVFRNGKIYAIRSRESLKNAVMVQSGMYDDLEVDVTGATQKAVSEELNASNCRALEGGYMNTKEQTLKRNSSFYFTDAVACDEFVNETRFHNNLFLAETYAKAHKINLQEKKGAAEAGLMPYQYEYDNSLKEYSLTIDLDKIGIDPNFEGAEASAEEKIHRVNTILDTIEHLTMVVKESMDNSEPLLIFGGIGPYKTHYFENIVTVKNKKLEITEDLKNRTKEPYRAGLLRGGNFENENEIISELDPISISAFFEKLREEVEEYYGK